MPRTWRDDVGPEVAAYVVAEALDGNAHVAQVSVDPTLEIAMIGPNRSSGTLNR